MDDLFTQALAAGIVRGDPDLIIQAPPPPKEEDEVAPVEAVVAPTVVQVLVIERGDASAVAQSVAQIRGLTGVIWVTASRLAQRQRQSVGQFPRRHQRAGLGAVRQRGWSVTNRGGVPSTVDQGGSAGGERLRHEVAGGPDRAPARLAASPGRQPLHPVRRQPRGVRSFPQLEPVAGQGDHC